MNDSSRDRLVDEIRARGGRVTPQRLAILRALQARPQHVTAEGLFEEVSAVVPGVSLPTVYSALELFEQLGLVRRVAALGAGAVVYDSRLDEHHHAVCRRCGAVADVDASLDTRALLKRRPRGFVAQDLTATIIGLCAHCASKAVAQ